MAPSPKCPQLVDHRRSTPLKNMPRPQHHAYPLGPPRRRPKCRGFESAVTADSARGPAHVKLLYTSDKYGQQIPSASYHAGVTKPHCTTPTRTSLQITTQYGTNTGHAIDRRACMRRAAEWPAYSAPIVLNSHRTPDPPASTRMHARHAFTQVQHAQ